MIRFTDGVYTASALSFHLDVKYNISMIKYKGIRV